MAEVWRGEARLADGYVERVAIKRVLPALASNPLYRRMLEDEARLGMMLKHPNIVRVYDAREVRGTFILVMELVDGVSLREVMGYLQERGSALSVCASLFIARELARALEHAHESIDEWGRPLEIIHRDVSPHNVLLGVSGDVKLMDFGLANATANLAERDPGMIGGKFGYLAPELVVRKESSHLLDIFALGIILWESLTGRRLFQRKDDGETVRAVARCDVPRASELNAQVDEDMQTVLDGLLCADPAKRYQSASEVGVDLDYLLSRFETGAGSEEVAMVVRLFQGTRASQQRHLVVESGVLAPGGVARRTGAGPVPRESGVRGAIVSPKLSESFAKDLETMAEAPKSLKGPPALPPVARNLRKA
jgi:serine/threonine-protein kinase